MKIVSKTQSIERKNSNICTVMEYPLTDNDIDFAIIKLAGRYPDKNYVINQRCKELVYVQDGNGKIVVNGKETIINAGDAIIIEIGEKFFWEGDVTLFISCTPAFTIEQHCLTD